MPYASAGGVRIYYEIHGEAGPALVLLHGSGAHHACWYQQVPHFQGRHRVVTIDFPGFGLSDSDAEVFDVREFGGSVVAVLDEEGLGGVVLVGQSMGGVPALAVALSHPERVAAVVLAASIGGISDQELDSVARADREQSTAKYSILERLMTDRILEHDPAKVFLYRQMSSFNVGSHTRVRNADSGEATLAQVREAITAGVEVTFLQGTADRITTQRTYDRLAELLPEGHIERAEGGSHLAYWEAPELFNAALDRILERGA